ncbi:hypothetical protein [Cyclobacterium plantarum]|uniref:Bacteriocin-type signal sequence n=1 Tax=Cyclobacterium plantarum TaxID=2716263 RepID=A0ABX0HCH9_9BACT|nr:hypothetical protein [Cyclobacterium plantarum]NHE58628.1 hypothetical protein [Cyclobacterium plantarum]
MKDLKFEEMVSISGGGNVWRWFGKVAAMIANNYDRNIDNVYSNAMMGNYMAD